MSLDDKEIQELSVDFNENYTDEDIQRRLSNLPRLRYSQGREMITAYTTYKDLENRHKRLVATNHLVARHKEELASEADRKAWSLTQREVKDSEHELLDAEVAYKSEQLKYDALDDIFTAVRKLASLRVAEAEDQKRADQFNSEGRGM